MRSTRGRGSTVRWSIVWALALGLGLAATACTERGTSIPVQPSNLPPITAPVRVLMLTATAGFRHDSIDTARQVMASLAFTSGAFTIVATEDLSALGAGSLAAYDVVFFALTSGELALAANQKAALLDFVSGGKGFLGVHSASDTLYAWSDYGRLVGAYFKEHPWTEQASVVVEDGTHPATAGLGSGFSIMEEFYTFQENPRPNVRVLLRLDVASLGGSGDYPLAWSHAFGQGRSYYNALGHFASTWNDPRFQQQLVGAIRWLGPER